MAGPIWKEICCGWIAWPMCFSFRHCVMNQPVHVDLRMLKNKWCKDMYGVKFIQSITNMFVVFTNCLCCFTLKQGHDMAWWSWNQNSDVCLQMVTEHIIDDHSLWDQQKNHMAPWRSIHDVLNFPLSQGSTDIRRSLHCNRVFSPKHHLHAAPSLLRSRGWLIYSRLDLIWVSWIPAGR